MVWREKGSPGLSGDQVRERAEALTGEKGEHFCRQPFAPITGFPLLYHSSYQDDNTLNGLLSFTTLSSQCRFA